MAGSGSLCVRTCPSWAGPQSRRNDPVSPLKMKRGGAFRHHTTQSTNGSGKMGKSKRDDRDHGKGDHGKKPDESSSDESRNWEKNSAYAMGEKIDDSFNDNSSSAKGSYNDNSTSTKNSNNDNSSNDDNSNNSSNDDNSTYTKNSNNDNSTSDSGNNSSTNNSNNDNSTDLDLVLKVDIADAFNDKSIDSSFNDASTSFGEIGVNFENVFNGAFSGGGHNTAFAVSQVADIVDHDTLSGFSQNNHGTFNSQAYADKAEVSGSWDDIGSKNEAGGNNVNDVTTIADGRASSSGTAFNMEVVMGANLQQNAFDAVVVGGNMDNDTTSGDSF